MKALILHLSDIHFKEMDNIILSRRKKFSEAIKNHVLDAGCVFIVASGDIAYSGKKEEYERAKEFFLGIKKDIESYSQNEIEYVFVPGNHDCDHLNGITKTRDILIREIKIKRDESIDSSVIEQCCMPQNNFFSFTDSFCSKNKEKVDKLVTIISCQTGKYKVAFYCYNTAWVSLINENQGSMYFPFNLYMKRCQNPEVDLVASVFHHGFNWHDHVNGRNFRSFIESVSHLVFIGHEHVSEVSQKDDLNGNFTEYFEGNILQDHGDENSSGFNIVVIDLENEMQKILKYRWQENMFLLDNQNAEWYPYKARKNMDKKSFELNNKFIDFLNDAGASFTHSKKNKLILEDFFVYPNLRDLRVKKNDKKDTSNDVINSENLFKVNSCAKILLIGDDKSGKTSLCIALYKNYYAGGYVPIYIEGHKIKSSSKEKFDKLINICFTEQYACQEPEKFNQLDNQKKVLIIDDFDEAELSVKYRAVLLNMLNRCYPNLIVIADGLFQVEEIIYEEERKNVFEDYQQFEFLEFGHLLRHKLIDRWNRICLEESVEEKDVIRKNDTAKRTIDTIIGRNFVPSYPIFLLTILQSIEAGTPHNLKESSYGHYYEYLIINALQKANIKADEFDVYYNYMIELANFFFRKGLYEISKDDLYNFHVSFCEEYKITLEFKVLLLNLTKAFILSEDGNEVKFRYRYVYYFFLAKYMANNIGDEDTRQKISSMCGKLYIEECANVIIFLVHHTKDKFVIDEIMNNAKNNFKNFKPAKLEKDTCVNKLMEEIPKLILEDSNVKENRENVLREQDKMALSVPNDNDVSKETELDEKGELDIISQLNLSFKTIEILGQILKNYYGSLKGDTKLVIGEEAYLIGLRALSSFFEFLEESQDPIINYIKDILQEKKVAEKDKIEVLARQFLFRICASISYSFIKKISEPIGSEKLSGTFKQILDKNDLPSFDIIDISIKLDFFKGFPYGEIQKLKVKFADNLLPSFLLRKMVINYLYMFETDYKNKQRICNILDIPMEAQRFIDKTSVQKKRK